MSNLAFFECIIFSVDSFFDSVCNKAIKAAYISLFHVAMSLFSRLFSRTFRVSSFLSTQFVQSLHVKPFPTNVFHKRHHEYHAFDKHIPFNKLASLHNDKISLSHLRRKKWQHRHRLLHHLHSLPAVKTNFG